MLICRLNMGVKFLKYDQVKNCWLGVEEAENACPISSLMQTVFRDIEVILRKYRPIILLLYCQCRLGWETDQYKHTVVG